MAGTPPARQGPYASEPDEQPRLEGRLVGHRSWQTLRCINGDHDHCPDRGSRCDCHCHALTTGSWIHSFEPA